MKSELLATAFWEWSLAFYATPENRKCLLLMQDRYGYNVNIVLWCLWSALMGYVLDSKSVIQVIESVEDLNNHAARRLREVRRYLSTPRPSLPAPETKAIRDDVFQAELATEKMMQTILANATSMSSPLVDFEPHEYTARRYFDAYTAHLDNPVILADDLADEAPQRLFTNLWLNANAENTA